MVFVCLFGDGIYFGLRDFISFAEVSASMTKLFRLMLIIAWLNQSQAFGASTIEGSAGASSLTTSMIGDYFECEKLHKEQRLFANLKPQWVNQTGELSTGAKVNAIVPRSNKPEIFESSLDLKGQYRAGRHRSNFSASTQYQDQLVQYGCSSSIDKRLERVRAEKEKNVLQGRELRAYAAGLEHQVGDSSDFLTARYSWNKSMASGSDLRQELGFRLDHLPSETVGINMGLVLANMHGSLQDFKSTGAHLGGIYRKNRRTAVDGEIRYDVRDNGSRAFNATGIGSYKLGHLSELYSRLSLARFFREDKSSQTTSEIGLRLMPKETEITAAAHRVELMNSRVYSGLWYSGEIRRKFNQQQIFEVKMSKGSPYPEQVRDLTSYSCGYGLQLGEPSLTFMLAPKLRYPSPNVSANLAYSYVQLIDITDKRLITRQWVWSIRASF